MDESLMYYCNDSHLRPDRDVYDSKMITSDADKMLELLSKCDEEKVISRSRRYDNDLKRNA
jgi:hypothetical protein